MGSIEFAEIVDIILCTVSFYTGFPHSRRPPVPPLKEGELVSKRNSQTRPKTSGFNPNYFEGAHPSPAPLPQGRDRRVDSELHSFPWHSESA
jgi:hypothetical protein